MNQETRQIRTRCYPCIFQQLLSLSKLTGLDESTERDFFNRMMSYMADNGERVVVQHVIREATDTVISLLGKPFDFDPYREVKTRSNKLALEHYARLTEKVKKSDSPLETALKIAAAGNIIDFGAKNHSSLDVEEELEMLEDNGFGVYDYGSFTGLIEESETLLYICDNSGEIVLDRIFIEQIKREFPGLNIVCAVREKPVINDAVMDDAVCAGLDKEARVISSGSVYPGTILDETSREFKEIYNRADIIIAKGQGNFETMLDHKSEKLFFILKIKCDLMAELSKTQKGDLVLMHNR